MESLGISMQEYRKYRNDKKSLNKIEGDKDSSGKIITGTASANKAYAIMNNDDYSETEKKYLINSLNTDGSKYKVSYSDLKKIRKFRKSI